MKPVKTLTILVFILSLFFNAQLSTVRNEQSSDQSTDSNDTSISIRFKPTFSPEQPSEEEVDLIKGVLNDLLGWMDADHAGRDLQ